MNENKYTAQTRMSDLIDDDASLLSSISRFGISLGFGNKTVHEACELNGIDAETFLAVINFLAGGNATPLNENLEKISIETVINYLRNAHSYFLSYKLPSIKFKLLEAVRCTEQGDAYSKIFLKFFDEYYGEVQKHIEFEDRTVFPYVSSLLTGHTNNDFNIKILKHIILISIQN